MATKAELKAMADALLAEATPKSPRKKAEPKATAAKKVAADADKKTTAEQIDAEKPVKKRLQLKKQ